jgi:SAM-dependent methyltransferase
MRRQDVAGPRLRAVRDAQFNDHRLVAVYDAAFGWTRADDFFLALARPGSRVLDVGCGTGRLALAFADAGHEVTGVDPAAASLDAARAKPGADRVRWLMGSASDLPPGPFDLAVMNSHVAQFIERGEAWVEALRSLRGALAPGGVLAFDSRDFAARAWEAWARGGRIREVMLPSGERVEMWTVLSGETAPESESFVHYYRFESDGAELTSPTTLWFRSERELRGSLAAADFAVEHIFGGWERQPVGEGDGEFIVVARAR